VVTLPTRYETLMLARSGHTGDLPAAFAEASRRARAAIATTTERETAIRDVATGVAAPALTGFVLWVLTEARKRDLRRLRFLSRDGQVFYELARRIAPELGISIGLEYVYSSRLTWSLAATSHECLSAAPWLFNSFMKPNAKDICARLGLPFDACKPALADAGVSLDPDNRADQPGQSAALHRFVASREVAGAAAERIETMRRLVTDYARQHDLAATDTGLVDAGWTGRMIGSLVSVCEAAGLRRPHALLWGHEPRQATGWTDSERIAAYMYNTATGEGLGRRVPDTPFVIETFCMGDHGIVTGYNRDSASGLIEPVLLSLTNAASEAWGLRLYRSAVYAFCNALTDHEIALDDDVRQLVHDVMDAFWCHPTLAEARTWSAYPYDSDPAGTALRPLGRPFTTTGGRGDRAWLAGSLTMSEPAARHAYLAHASAAETSGAPVTD
jgi:hypothetical protein